MKEEKMGKKSGLWMQKKKKKTKAMCVCVDENAFVCVGLATCNAFDYRFDDDDDVCMG